VRIGVPVKVSANGGGTVLLDADGVGQGAVGGAAGAGASTGRSVLGASGGGLLRSGSVAGGWTGGGGGGAPRYGAGNGGVEAEASQVSFRHATADLPPAATATVRQMLAEHRAVTVLGIHRRRPPYLDLGPPINPADMRVESNPERFASTLRAFPNEVVTARPQLHLFKVGSAPPWQQSKSGGSYAQTFEFAAKFTGLKYYQSDFTEARPAALRPPTAPSTRADLGPSFLTRPGVHETRDMRWSIKAGDIDASVRMSHADEHLPPRRAVVVPGAHLLPYPNADALFRA
jgi:hypothetical protein